MVVYYKTPRNLWTAIFSQYFDLLDFFFLAPRVPNVVANMNEKVGEEKQDCKKGLRRGTKSNDIIQVYSLIIGNLIDEIILLLPDSNPESLNNKANVLSTDPAKKVPPNSFKFL